MPIRHTVKAVVLALLLIRSVLIAFADEKPSWTASPSAVYQHQGSYPTTLNIRLFLNSCKYQPNGQPVANQLPGSYSLTVSGTGVSSTRPVSGDCSLTATLTIGSAAQQGIEVINVSSADKDIGFAPLSFMDATAGPSPDKPEVDVLWEVLTDHLCRDNFGNHMPGDLYCVDVKIGNNSGHALQLSGLGFLRKNLQCKGLDNEFHSCRGEEGSIATPNVSYQTARASAETGQSTSFRNLLFNGTQALGLLMASFTPFFDNSFNKSRWSTGAAIVSGSITQGINLIAPDLTTRELNSLDDQAFRDGKIISNNTQVRLLVFVQKQSLAEAIGEIVPQIQAANVQTCLNPVQIGYIKVRGNTANQCQPGWEKSFSKCLSRLECNPAIVKLALGRIVIIGDKIDFIQRIVIDPNVTAQQSPTSTSITSFSLLAAPGAGIDSATLTGTSLDQTKTLSLACSDSVNPADPAKTFTGTAVIADTTEPTQITFKMPAAKTLSTTASCTVTLTTKGGQAVTATAVPK